MKALFFTARTAHENDDRKTGSVCNISHVFLDKSWFRQASNLLHDILDHKRMVRAVARALAVANQGQPCGKQRRSFRRLTFDSFPSSQLCNFVRYSFHVTFSSGHKGAAILSDALQAVTFHPTCSRLPNTEALCRAHSRPPRKHALSGVDTCGIHIRVYFYHCSRKPSSNLKDVLDHVNPLIGSDNGGNVFAGATRPFSFAKAVADVSPYGQNTAGFSTS